MVAMSVVDNPLAPLHRNNYKYTLFQVAHAKEFIRTNIRRTIGMLIGFKKSWAETFDDVPYYFDKVTAFIFKICVMMRIQKSSVCKRNVCKRALLFAYLLGLHSCCVDRMLVDKGGFPP